MINPGDLVEALANAYRDVESLVAAMASDETRISAYVDRYPGSSSILKALATLPSPGMLVAYEGFGPSGRREASAWRHQVSVYLKLGPVENASDAADYYEALQLLVEGVVKSTGRRILDSEVQADCLPMDVPACSRRTLMLDQSTALDYWVMVTAFPEKGDA